MYISPTGSKRLLLVLVGLLSIFASTIFSQRLSRGSKPTERSLPNVLEAVCSELPHDFSVCRIRKNENGEAEFIVHKGRAIVNKIEAPFWGTATGGGPTDFFAYRGDLDRDGSSEVVLVSLDGVSQGMGVTYATAYIFDGRTVETRGLPISVPIQEFGDGENFIYDSKTRRTNILITYWDDYNSIDPERGWGLYLLGKWFTYDTGKLHPTLTEPTLARRFLNSFASVRDNGWFENRRPYSWLMDRRTHKLHREPKTTAELVKVTLGRIASYSENEDGSSEFRFATDNGQMIAARLNSSTEQKKVDSLGLAAIGMWKPRYLYPVSRSGAFRLSAFRERIEGRRVRLETYQHEFGDEFGRLWFLD